MGKVYHVNVNQNEVVVAIFISGKVYFKQRLLPGIQNETDWGEVITQCYRQSMDYRIVHLQPI